MKVRCGWLLLAATLVTAGAASAAPALHAQYLGEFRPYRMNETGQIIGNQTFGGAARGFVVSDSTPLLYLPLPPGMASSIATDISDTGVVVGATSAQVSPEFGGVAIAWDPDGQGGFTYRLLGALPGQTLGRATAVNDLGDIVGWSSDGTYRYAALFTDPDGVQNLNSLIFDPVDINNQRVVVDGSFTVKRLDLDTMVVEDLGVPAGGGYLATSSVRINEAGQVGGLAIRATSQDADREPARYTDGVGWEIFGPVGVRNSVMDMNEQGDCAILLYTDLYVRYEGGGTHRVEDLIVDEVGHWGVSYLSGFTLNSSGWIATYATNDVTGEVGTILLKPSDPAGVDEVTSTSRLALSAGPNPFRDGSFLRFELPSADRVSLRVVDVNGRTVRDLLDRSELSAGVCMKSGGTAGPNRVRALRPVYCRSARVQRS
ncbi:MAG: hypothetical protein R3E97_02280 [Candidatus Eisenbacteria bacterium]